MESKHTSDKAPQAKVERNKEVYTLRLSGLTAKAVGEKFGISGARVEKICQREEKRFNQANKIKL